MAAKASLTIKLFAAILFVVFLFLLYLSRCIFDAGFDGEIIVAGVVAAGSLFMSICLWDISMKSPADSHSIKTLLLQYVLTTLMTLKGKRVYHSLIGSTRNVRESQERLLLEILQANKNTNYGTMMNFGDISTREEYTTQHKLQHYNDYEPYIQRMESGEQNVLVADEVVYFATTSGTTGKNKSIPITVNMKGPGAMKVGPMMYYFMDTCAGLNLQRVMSLSYRAITQVTQCGLQKGPVTQHMSKYLPFVVSPREAFELTDEQLALHAHAVFALQEVEIGRIEAAMSTLVYAFWMYLENNWELVLHDIEHATLSVTPLQSDDISNTQHNTKMLIQLAKKLTPNPNRAKTLRSEFKLGFENIANRIWPNLTFVRMLTTGGFEHHSKFLRRRHMRGITQLSQVHACSEGFLGFDTSGDAQAMTYMPMIEYGFLEFILEEDIEESNPATYFAEQVSVGNKYEMVITSPMGLYRYRTGDVVEIVNFVNECPIYKFLHRVGQLLNLFWEKLPESVFYRVLCKSIADLDREMVDYTATEDVNTRAIACTFEVKCYMLFVEMRNPGPLSNAEKERFDKQLCIDFELYNTLRKNRSIGPMQVIQVKAGTFMSLKARTIADTQTQQYKVPRVMRNPIHLRFLWDNRDKAT